MISPAFILLIVPKAADYGPQNEEAGECNSGKEYQRSA
jgi:hypothetical protein